MYDVATVAFRRRSDGGVHRVGAPRTALSLRSASENVADSALCPTYRSRVLTEETASSSADTTVVLVGDEDIAQSFVDDTKRARG